MEIVFAGICCWIDSVPPGTGKTVIIPNASRGGAHRGTPIPPHSAFIHVKKGQVETTNWEAGVTSEDNLIFLLDGESITFDPVPSGGAIDISALPHVRDRAGKEPICRAADELRPGFVDKPEKLRVAGLVRLPADADVTTSANGNGATFAVLRMPNQPVTITATPFSGSGARTLRITDPSATVFIANVTLMEYLRRTPAATDDHQFLVCHMFTARSAANDTAAAGIGREVMLAELAGPEGEPVDFDAASALTGTSATAEDFFCGFAAGCSDSQWP